MSFRTHGVADKQAFTFFTLWLEFLNVCFNFIALLISKPWTHFWPLSSRVSLIAEPETGLFHLKDNACVRFCFVFLLGSFCFLLCAAAVKIVLNHESELCVKGLIGSPLLRGWKLNSLATALKTSWSGPPTFPESPSPSLLHWGPRDGRWTLCSSHHLELETNSYFGGEWMKSLVSFSSDLN